MVSYGPHSQSSTNTGIWKDKTQADAVLVGLGLLVAVTSSSVQGCFVFSGMIFYIKMQNHPSAIQLFRPQQPAGISNSN